MDGTGQEPVAHPVVFLALYLPFSMPIGFASVVLARRLHESGVGAAAIGSLIALMIGVQLGKIVWAPVVDALFSFKGWYAVMALAAAAAIAAAGAIAPTASSMPTLITAAVALSAAVSVMGMATEGLMAYATAPAERGRAGGWSQAGNLLGSAIGGGGGLWLTTHLDAPWQAGALLGLLPLLCAGALLFVREPRRERGRGRIQASLAGVFTDVWATLRSKPGLLALLLFVSPLGCSAAGNLVGALAGDWRVSADLLAAVTGLGSGAAALIGAVAGGYLCDRLERKTAYLLFGLLLAAVALAMAASPRTPGLFVAFALAYAAATGLVQAAFAAVTLETIGRGAAATKFTLFAAVSNAPFAYMALVEGWARERWSAGAMLALEGALGIASGLAFIVILFTVRPRAVPAPAV